MSIPGRRIQVNGIALNVYVEGDGEPVFLLHGFPDSNYLWRGIIPRLVKAGYRVIAPDQRGFGESEAPEGKENYKIELIARDAVGVLDALDIPRTKLVTHDWGAMIGWLLAGAYPERFENYTAISVGHPSAYASAGFEQKKKGWYVLFFQLEGIAEKAVMAKDWALFRKTVHGRPEMEHWVEDLSRPGRLTAGMNWYRANLSSLWKASFPRVFGDHHTRRRQNITSRWCSAILQALIVVNSFAAAPTFDHVFARDRMEPMRINVRVVFLVATP